MRVLIVDDDSIICHCLKKEINWEKLGCHEINICYNGNQALTFIQEHRPNIVISDVRMPMMDGRELCKVVYEKFPSIMKQRHRYRLRNISLGIKIPALICMVLVCLVGTASMILYQYYYRLSADTINRSMESVITMNEGEVANFLDMIFSAVDVVNDNDTAYQISNANGLSNIANQIVNYVPLEDQSNLYENLQLLEKNKNTFKDLFQIIQKQIKKGMTVSLLIEADYPITHLLMDWPGLGKETTGIEKSTKAEQTEWYRKAVEAGGENYWFCHSDFPDRIFLAKQLNYKYLSKQNEYSVRQLGVILVSINMAWIDTHIKTAELTAGTQIYLTDLEGNIFFTTGEKLFAAEMVSEYIVKEKEESQYKTLNDVRYLIRKSDIGHGLCLMTAIPVYEIDHMAFQMVRMILIVCCCILVFGMVFMILLSRWMLKPIVKLSEQMEKGVLEAVDASSSGQDEIGCLYQNYNRMQNKIQELLQQVWVQAETQKNAEIHALQMQINPHFIFNTLSTISGLALLNGQDQIAEQLKLLTALMRYNTRNPDGMVLLQTEISMIQKYEEIQHFSFNDCITFHYSIMPECENILIPKMIIQPLVENTIVHSRGKNGEGTVTITAKIEAEYLIVQVTDGGKNVDTDLINRYIRGENVFENAKESFGIRNVYDRIHLIYGERGNLEYRHTPEGNTEAVVTIQVK